MQATLHSQQAAVGDVAVGISVWTYSVKTKADNTGTKLRRTLALQSQVLEISAPYRHQYVPGVQPKSEKRVSSHCL